MSNNFSFNQVGSAVLFDISVGCPIRFCHGTTDRVRVEIEGEADDVTARADGNTVYINQKSTGASVQGMTISGSGNVVIGGISGGSVIQSGGVTYINSGSGKVFVNGVDVTTVGDGKPFPKPPSIVVYCNVEVPSLQAKLSGLSALTSTIKFKTAFIEASGSSNIALPTESLELVARGSVDVTARVEGGELDISCSGSADIDVSGSFSKVSINVSGSADIVTNGKCNGDYKAVASGSGSIRHTGEVLGRVRESSSGSATIRI